MSNGVKTGLRMVPVIIVMGIIFYLSNQPGDQLNLPGIPYICTIGHFCIYSLLAAATLNVPSKEMRKTRPRTTLVVTLLFCFLYSLSDEYHQSFIPGRDASSGDILADLCGILFVLIVWRTIDKQRNGSISPMMAK